MKKLILLVLTIAVGIGLQAQGKERMHERGQRDGSQKFESMKIAHLTDALELTPEEAEKFWPVYNKWNDQKKALRQGNRPAKKVEDMTQEEAETFIQNTIASRRQASELDAAMQEDLKGILSATKRMKLIKAEENFHQSMVKRFKKRRKGEKGKRQAPKDGEDSQE